jgi:ankyrin repeat protein
MFRRYAVFGTLGAFLALGAFAQTPAKTEFGRDIQPLLRQNCIGCHGPSQQMNGLRLDRKSSVFKTGARRVVPGSSENSFLYHRVAGSDYGLQMPPTGALKPEQVAMIKSWIDQGAEWPDALANEVDLPPLNPKAVAMVDALRIGDRPAFMKFVAQDPKLLNARGPEGSTPFMYAVLYGDAAFLEQLLKKGADPNARNDAKATPLMWAATDIGKTRLLLAHGTDVNAQADDARTPLMIAAGRPGGAPLVKLLLDRGANPNPTKNPPGESSPLIQAALATDVESMQLLMNRGADFNKLAGAMALAMALTQNCSQCVDLIVKKSDLGKDAYTMALVNIATFADVNTVRLMLDHGADVNAVDPSGRTALIYAAASDLLSVDVVKLLIERGANVNAKSQHPQSGDSGLTPLDLAKLLGDTPVVDALLKAGAVSSAPPAASPRPQPAVTVQAALERSLPLLQRADSGFTSKSGCISCHNDSLTAMAVGLARKNGLPVDERIAAEQLKRNAAYLEHERESLHEGFFAAQAGAEVFADTFGASVLGYILVGLDAEHYKPDLNTDAVAMYLKMRQTSDGNWIYTAGDTRPPICFDYIGQTALAMRGLQLYAPRVDKAEYQRSIQLAAAWLAKTEPKSFEDRVWRVLGLAWAGNQDAAREAVRALAGLQRPDGGWSDLPTMNSNAYSTGRALVALQTAGLPVSDPAYRRGVQFLRNTQMEDGSWYVKTRALALQPYFDAGFPHGVDQFISSAGTSWATMALTLAAPAAGLNTTAEAALR